MRRRLLMLNRWTPAHETGLSAWYRSTDSVVDSANNVSKLYDISGNKRDLSQSVASAQPLLAGDGLPNPIIQFNGTSHFLRANNTVFGNLAQPATYYYVIKQITWGGGGVNHYIVDGITGTDRNALAQMTADASPVVSMFAGNSAPKTSDLAVGVYGILTCVFNSASSLIRVNKAAGTSGNAGVQGITGFTLGSDFSASPSARWANFAFCELVIRNQADATSIQNLHIDYLARKWGIAV